MCAQGSLRRMFRCRDFDRSYQLGGYAIFKVSTQCGNRIAARRATRKINANNFHRYFSGLAAGKGGRHNRAAKAP